MADLTFGTISANVPNVLQNFEDRITEVLNVEDPTAADLFNMQQAVTEWSLANNTFSTILKSLGDTLRNTLQKIN